MQHQTESEVRMSPNGHMRTAEVAERLGVSPRTIARWIEKGHFPNAFKVKSDTKNSPYVIPKSDVEAYEQKQKGEGSSG